MRSIFSGIFLLFTLAILAGGCDLGTYGSRYNDRVGKMTSMANSNKDLADTLIDVAGVAKIRVPKICNDDKSAKFDKSSDFNKARIPGFEIDGFVSSFLGDKEGGDQWLPFQVYFYYNSQNNIVEVKKNLKQLVKAKLPSESFTWNSRKMEAYDGKEYLWENAKAGGGLPFLIYENNVYKETNLNGVMDFYVTANDNGVLIVVFRAPTSIFGLDEQPLVEGTLKSIQGFQ